MSDARFARLKTDPRFRRPKKAQAKVVVDKRFESLFDDAKKGGAKEVDKYGRKVSKNKDRDNLRRFYKLDKGDEEGQDQEEGTSTSARPDFARGEGLMESSSEDEDEDEDAQVEEDSDGGEVVLGRDASKPIRVLEEAEIDLDEDTIAELDAQAAAYSRQQQRPSDKDPDVEPTTRIAVVNLDWDHVNAGHLYKIFASVDKIRSVRIYPSEFGKKRMEQEEREGPPQEIFGTKKVQVREEEMDEDDINEKTIFEVNDGQEYDQDALRKYQLERLRYYYAIVTCDSVQAASHIYSELEGSELERSANVLDLSYVPEAMSFDDDEPRDEATEDQTGFRAIDFTTDALRHSRVRLTWDNDDPDRVRLTRRAMSKKDLDEIDFKAYIASDSDEEESGGEEERRKRMRALLLREGSDAEEGADDDDQLPEGWGAGKPDKAGELEITFTPGLTDKKAKDDGEETTLDKYKRKQKEKKAARKATRKGKTGGEDDEDEVPAGDDFFGGSDDDELAPAPAPKKDKKKKHEKLKTGDSRQPATKAELSRLVAEEQDDDDLEHFDMRAVIRADKAEKTGVKGKRKLKRKLAREQEVAGSGFVLDVADKRFDALHEDPAFAIDPSNPKFKRTKGMEALLDERTKRSKKQETMDAGDGLENLVASVKRKSKDALEQRDRKKRRV